MDVIAYATPMGTRRCCDDNVSYIDSKGCEHEREKGLNIYWDFEVVEEQLSTEIDWEQRRYDMAKELVKAFAANPHNKCVSADIETLARWGVECADSIITKLKKGTEQ